MPGGRPQKYDSDDERKAADAERKRLARQQVDPELPERQVDEPEPEPAGEMVEFEGRLLPRVHSCSWDEETYVAHHLEQTKLFHAQTSPQATLSTVTLDDRLERAERYARWRYNGFLAGEIASL